MFLILLFYSCAIGFLIVLTAMATIHDVFWGQNPVERSSITDFFNCFSLKRNGREILSTKINGNDNLSCLYGIRFICMFLLIAFHSQYKFSANVHNIGTATEVFLNKFLFLNLRTLKKYLHRKPVIWSFKF